MYALIGLAFVGLLALTIKYFGIWSLLWAPLGFGFGLLVGAQIILPITMGIPRSIWLVKKSEIRAGVIGRLLVTPIIWLVGLIALGFFWPSLAQNIYNNQALNLGANLGLLGILLSPLSKKARSDYVADYNKAYEKFFTSSIGTVYEEPRLTLTRANQIVDRLSVISDSGGFNQPLPLSKVGASSTAEVLQALYLVTAETFKTASTNNTQQNRTLLQNYLRAAGGTGMWVAVMCRADNKINTAGDLDDSVREMESIDSFVDFLKTIDPASKDYWAHVFARIGI